MNVANIHNNSCRYRTVLAVLCVCGLVSLFLISISDFSVPLFLLLQATIKNCVLWPDRLVTVTSLSCLESGSFWPWVILAGSFRPGSFRPNFGGESIRRNENISVARVMSPNKIFKEFYQVFIFHVLSP